MITLMTVPDNSGNSDFILYGEQGQRNAAVVTSWSKIERKLVDTFPDLKERERRVMKGMLLSIGTFRHLHPDRTVSSDQICRSTNNMTAGNPQLLLQAEVVRLLCKLADQGWVEQSLPSPSSSDWKLTEAGEAACSRQMISTELNKLLIF